MAGKKIAELESRVDSKMQQLATTEAEAVRLHEEKRQQAAQIIALQHELQDAHQDQRRRQHDSSSHNPDASHTQDAIHTQDTVHTNLSLIHI